MGQASSVQSSVTQKPAHHLPSRQCKKAGWNIAIATVAIAAFLLLAGAAFVLTVFSGFMFSIGVVPDGMYLLITAVAAGALAGYVGYKAYKRGMIAHNYLNPKPALTV